MVLQKVVGKKEGTPAHLMLKSENGNKYPAEVAPGIKIPSDDSLWADVVPGSWIVRKIIRGIPNE